MTGSLRDGARRDRPLTSGDLLGEHAARRPGRRPGTAASAGPRTEPKALTANK